MKHVKTYLSLAASLAVASSATAQALFSESFEAAPGSTYTIADAFDDGSFDFFGRYAVPDTTNGARDDFTSGFDGGFAIFSQDNDGEGGPATVSVLIPGIDVSGGSSLSVTGLFGALNSAPDFLNYEAADGDGIGVFAQIDGGGFVKIGGFAPSGTANDLLLDSDLDGVGDGAILTTDLAQYAFNLPVTGNTLDIRIDLTSTGSFEPIALDNVTVVPEPSTYAALVGLMVLSLVFYRRRK